MRKWAILMLLPLLATLSGCILVAAAGAGTGVLYVQGAAVKSYPHDVERMYAVVVTALEAEGIIVGEKYASSAYGKVKGVAADGKKVTVDLKVKGDGVTEVKVRVGTLGNRGRSERLINRISQGV